jgi:hypothetical protein
MDSIFISVTREILARSYRCGTENEIDMIGNHCPIAMALHERYPDAYVSGTHIHLFGNESDADFALPKEAINFIHLFDSLADTPEERMDLPELTFEVVREKALA